MGTLNLTSPWMFFGKSSLMPAPGFSFTVPHLTFITDHHAYSLFLDIFSYVKIHITLKGCSSEVRKKYKLGHTLASTRSKTGLPSRKESALHIHTQTHILICIIWTVKFPYINIALSSSTPFLRGIKNTS